MAVDSIRIPAALAWSLITAAVVAGGSGLLTAINLGAKVSMLSEAFADDQTQHEVEAKERQEMRERIIRIEEQQKRTQEVVGEVKEEQKSQRGILEEIRREVKKP